MKFRYSKFIRKIAEYFWNYAASDGWRAIYSLLEKNDGCTSLDLGCGDGKSTMLVAEYVGVGKVIGLDLDDESLRKASFLLLKADLNKRLPLGKSGN